MNFGSLPTSTSHNWLSSPSQQQNEDNEENMESQIQEDVSEPKPRQTLPIRVSLDLSDEKSQDLFIYQQKYNTKKEEYINLENKKKQFEKENKERDNEIELLKEQNI